MPAEAHAQPKLFGQDWNDEAWAVCKSDLLIKGEDADAVILVPDAWIDPTKTKVGYEIPLNRHFYRYEPPRPLEVIERDLRGLENEIVALLKEVTA